MKTIMPDLRTAGFFRTIGKVLILGIAVYSKGFVAAYAVPPYQTRAQRNVVGQKSATAHKTSINATDALLKHLGSNLSRTHLLFDCPLLANLSAEAILGRFLAETRVSELIESVGGGPYENATELPQTNFMPNIWEAVYMNVTKYDKKPCGIEDQIETGVFGLPPFFSGCPPTNYSEAVDRLNYASLNFVKAPMGYSFYPISIVFNRSYVHDQVLVAPMDTGKWRGCLRYTNMSLNCSGWYFTRK
jgi:hypothetical protein